MLHASGKFVSSILSYLQPSLNAEQSAALTQFHDSVLKLLSTAPDSDDTKLILAELEEKMEKIKTIASSYKKIGTTTAE